MDKERLLLNINKLHTTKLGVERIKNNLKIDGDVVDYCKKFILDSKCEIKKVGKNYYCEKDNIIITINSFSFTIITCHFFNFFCFFSFKYI